MPIAVAREENRENIAAPVIDIRSRIDGKNRFRKALSGYDSNQVNQYLEELNLAASQERAEHQSTVLGLQRSLREKAEQIFSLQEDIAAVQADLAALTEQLRQAAAREEQHLTELDNLAQSLARKNQRLQEAEGELTAWQGGQGTEECIRLTQELEKLFTENGSLKTQAESAECEAYAKRQLIEELQRKNLSLEQEIEGRDRRVLEMRLERSRGISAIKTLQSTSVAAIISQLEGCVGFLNAFNDKALSELEQFVGNVE